MDPGTEPNFQRSLAAELSLGVARISEAVLPTAMLARLREGREWETWVAKLDAEVFEDLTGAPAWVKRQLFVKHVTLVEIEVHAKCNRICPFCPNVIVDRRRNDTRTDSELLDRVFDELGSVDYRRQIKIARYSEPLADLPYLYDRIRAARAKVPHAELAIVTNTDYLRPAVLEALRDAGLDTLYMSIYLKAREKWSLALAHAYSRRLSAKLAVPISSRSETAVSLRCTYRYRGLHLHSACINFDEYGTDRGDLLKQYALERRVGPCREPFDSFVLDYTGKVMPCCNLRSDVPEHRECVAGDLSDAGTSIFDIYAGRLAAWRRSMIGFDRKQAPCTTCRHRDISAALAGPLSKQVTRRLSQIGRSDLTK